MGNEIYSAKITFVRLHDFDVNIHKKIEATDDQDALETAKKLAKQYKEEFGVWCDYVRVVVTNDNGFVNEIKDVVENW